MYLNDKIEFQAERDFGMRLNAAFDFIKRNFLPLVSSMLVVIVPLLAIGGAASLLLFRYLQTTIFKDDNPLSIAIAGFLFFVFYFVIISFLPSAVVYSYIKLYREREESVFTVGQVLGELKRHWLKLLGAMVLIYVTVIFATMFFIIPGIYVAIPLAFVPYIIVVEDMNVIEAIARAFQTIKNHWWESLGIIIVALIITSLFSWAFQLPFTVLVGAMPFLVNNSDVSSLGFWGLLTVGVYMVGNFLVQIIPAVVYAFHYHHLVEIKEGTGLMGRISRIGKHSDPTKQYADEEETY